MDKLVAYLLAHRYRIPNRSIITCLALAQLGPKPTERISFERLMEVLGACSQSHVSRMLGQLRRCDLVDYEAGVPGDPGYLFWRVGPQRCGGKQP